MQYYVLRTHGSLKSPWGFTCIGIFPSQAKAIKHVKDILNKEPSKDKYVIAKHNQAYSTISWKTGQIGVN